MLPPELIVTGPWVCKGPTPESNPLLVIAPFVTTSVFGSDKMLPAAMMRLRTPPRMVPLADVTVVVLMMWISTGKRGRPRKCPCLRLSAWCWPRH